MKASGQYPELITPIMTTTLTVRLPAALAREFKAKAKAAKTSPSAVLRQAATEFVRRQKPASNGMQEHCDAHAGTWDGHVSRRELLRRTRP